MEVLDFPNEIKKRWRVERERIGDTPEDWDIKVELNANRGFAYMHSADWAGVWLTHAYPQATMKKLAKDFPSLVIQQVGVGEGTFRVSVKDLDRMLERLGGKRRPRLTDEQREAQRKSGIELQRKYPIKAGINRPAPAPESTEAA